MSAQAIAMLPNVRPPNERTKAVNERTNKITRARTNIPDNRTSGMPAKQTENGLIARTNARKPGNSTNGLNTPISFQNKQKQCQFGSQYRKVFLGGFNKD